MSGIGTTEGQQATTKEQDRPPIVNLADLVLTRHAYGSTFEALTGAVAAPLGATRLGCRLVVVPPGKRAWPFHAHHANEELFVILEGEGTLRFGAGRYGLRPGDVIVCPAGGSETAHQILNDRQAPLHYLAISTMHEPDVMEYPDSDKFGVVSGAAPGGDKARRRLAFFGRLASAVDYHDGELED